MNNITIYPSKPSAPLCIDIKNLPGQWATLFLLGPYGEELERFSLKEGINEITLPQYPTGTYAIRIETGQEVIVKQIKL